MLFGCYRRGDANDPETYVAAIAAVLARYEPDLIREVTDPNTGIVATEKYMTFMPNAGELKVYCEGVASRRERLERLGSLPPPVPRLPPPPPAPGDLAKVFVPQDHKRYPRLVEWSKTANKREWKFEPSSDGRAGIWVSWHIWDEGTPIARKVGDAARAVQDSLSLSPAALKAVREKDALYEPEPAA